MAKLYQEAYPFADSVLTLPVKDVDQAAKWYGEKFDLREVTRCREPLPTVIMEREGVRLGFQVNGGDAANDGAAILVADAARARDELVAKGVETGNWRVDERDGVKHQVFFVVAPDGLCYYFHQRLDEA